MVAKKKSPKKLVDDPAFARWREEGKALKVSTHQWTISDWILRGIETFKKKKTVYDEAVKLTGMTRQTLQQFKLTAERFPKLTRVKELTFGHHRVVANRDKDETPEQRRWLFLKYGNGETIEGLIAGLRTYDEDNADGENFSSADLAANKIVLRVEAFEKFLGRYDFDTVLDEEPETRYVDLLKVLKDAATRLAEKITELENAWCEDEQASEETKAMGVGV